MCVNVKKKNLNHLNFYNSKWGEMPTSVAYIGTGQIMGWGNKAIEVP